MAELVGGAFLSSFLNVLFDRMATSEFLDFFRTRKMDMGLLDELKALLLTVCVVIDDAEDRQLASPGSKVKDFLDGLRVAAYEADDLLDLISYEVTAAKIEADQRATAGKQSWYSSLSNLRIQEASVNDRSKGVSFSRDASERMEKIAERLRSLKQNIDTLGLRKSIGRKDEWPQREQTTSLVEESEIFGRDADRDAILNLLEEDGVDGNAIGVIPIVGMGGIGKTTLAQLVYNHRKAQEFESRARICVSDNYDSFKIKKELLKQVNNSVRCDYFASEQIDVELKKSLKDKRYLLVLDDIWDDGYDNWDRLQAPLKSGARGSKIIITTRNQKIASKMGTVASGPCELRELDAHSCWQLFAKHAFKGGKGDERLESIGKEIARKCKGLPLAAKMLGDLLRGEHKVAKWEAILESDMWELPDKKVLPALMLSYQHLPSQLKQCFAYCAIFPKDYEMRKENIIQLWMAEGFLVQPIRGKKMEEFGEECFDELVSRSFLQKSFYKWGGSFFGMHDLINDLAQHISGEFIVRMEEDRSNKIGNKTRHFSFAASEFVLENISEGHKLRTFLCLRALSKGIADEVLLNQIVKLQCLRALSLSHFYKVVELPDQIGDLKLLRYLNLAETSVERLPDSVCTLYNLQTLILSGCHNLVELPKDIGSLINLQTLNLYSCYGLLVLPKDIGRLINLHCLHIRDTWRLKEMPLGMGNLKELRTLCKFIVGKQIGSDINELGKLHLLQGELSIYNLQNVVDTPNDILKNKKHLEELKLVWSGETEDSQHERRVLEGLQPYTSINKLSISGYGGTKFADWVGDSSYSNIISLELDGCKYCTSLPPLGQLSFLEHLEIRGFDGVLEVGAEFYGSCSRSMKKAFRSLKKFRIRNMREWRNWVICGENDSVKCETFPELKELEIWDCPNLRSVSSTHKIFKSLNRLQVGSCIKIKTSNLLAISDFKVLELICAGRHVLLEQLPSAMYRLHIDEWRWGQTICNPTMEGIEEMCILFNALEDITITQSGICECIPLEMLPNLKSLFVWHCDELKSLSASEEPLHQPLTSLASLKIFRCRSLVSFPKGGITAPNLTRLELLGCRNLKSLPEGMLELLPSLLHLMILGCYKIESFPEGGLPANLQSLEIGGCDKLIGGRLQWGLQRLNALSRLRLSDYKGQDLHPFPEETLLPSTLTSLEIIQFYSLKVINYKGLLQLTSLDRLEISYCRNLHCLAKDALPSSLCVLKIEECPKLESFPEGGLPANLQSLEIKKCYKLIGGRLQWGLHRLNALSRLSLYCYDGDDLDSFPEETLLPSTLTTLEIRYFYNLKGINYEGLQHLTSLAELEIWFCPNLQCLPEQRLPSSLSDLEIYGCPILKERCEREKGEDWPKISHISNIQI